MVEIKKSTIKVHFCFVVNMMLIGSIIFGNFLYNFPGVIGQEVENSTLYVGENATYKNIQDAIDAAKSGDTIYVYKGTYNEKLRINKSISLFGESVDRTIINSEKHTIHLINISSSNVKIKNFFLRCDRKNVTQYAVSLYKSINCNISNNIFSNNFRHAFIFEKANNNSFFNNTILTINASISIWNSDSNYFFNNYIQANSYDGITLTRSHYNIFNNNAISKCYKPITLRSSDNNSFNNNTIWDFYGSIYLEKSNGNSFFNNSIRASFSNCISLFKSHRNNFNGNNISDCFKTFYLVSSDNNSIIKNIVTNSETSLYLNGANFTIISDNNLKGNEFGINCAISKGSLIKNNTINAFSGGCIIFEGTFNDRILNNKLIGNGIYIWDTTLKHIISLNIDKNNLLNGRPIYFWKNESNKKIPEDAGQVILVNCSDIEIRALKRVKSGGKIDMFSTSRINIINNYLDGYNIYSWKSNNISIKNNTLIGYHSKLLYQTGIVFDYTNNNLIENNEISNYSLAINIWRSKFAIIKTNNISNSRSGIFFSRNNHNFIKDNLITKIEDKAIRLSGSNYNSIINNQILYNNKTGIFLSRSSNNSLKYNTIAFNKGLGLEIELDTDWSDGNRTKMPSDNNTISQNNFINNNLDKFYRNSHVLDECKNHWDSGYPAGGNFWSDYPGVDEKSGIDQDEPGSDGIGDVGLNINRETKAMDHYPLMAPNDRSLPLPNNIPNTPHNFQAGSGDGFVKLTWSAPLYNGSSNIIKYHIYRWNIGSQIYDWNYQHYNESFVLNGNELEFTDTNVKNGEIYHYTISAENEIGIGPNSSRITGEPEKPAKKPGRPGGFFGISWDVGLHVVAICFSILGLIIIVTVIGLVKFYFRRKSKRGKKIEKKK